MDSLHEIFISYSRNNLKTVKQIKDEIEKSTLATYWVDLDGIESGTEKFTKSIIQAINSCPIFLFMLSEKSQQSENALKELAFAYKKHREEGKKVVIVYIEKCTMTDEFCFHYSMADTIDWHNTEQRTKLIRDLRFWTNYHKKQVFINKNNKDVNKKFDIFICYRREGGAQYAHILQLMLQQRGYSVFLDYDELTDGKFGDEIACTIKETPIFMLVLSSQALERCKNENDWVRHEILLAMAERKQIIPVNPDNMFDGIPTDIPAEIQTAVSSHQYSEIGFGQTLGQTMDFMIKQRIAPIVGTRPQKAHIDTNYDAAKLSLEKIDIQKRFIRRLGVVGGTIAILILLGAVILWVLHLL